MDGSGGKVLWILLGFSNNMARKKKTVDPDSDPILPPFALGNKPLPKGRRIVYHTVNKRSNSVRRMALNPGVKQFSALKPDDIVLIGKTVPGMGQRRVNLNHVIKKDTCVKVIRISRNRFVVCYGADESK